MAGIFATSHDVYFGTSIPPSFIGNQTATTFEPGTMSKNTTYYWRIDEVNPWGTTTGAVWSFTTESGRAYSPDPADNSTIDGYIYEDNIFAILSFDAGVDANTHEVFFSDDEAKVTGRDPCVSLGAPYSGTTYYAGIPDANWTPYIDSLVRGTTYYWCADETDNQGQLWQGAVWSFTVRLGKASNPNPADEQTLVSTTPTLSWAAGATEGFYAPHMHDIYFGTNEADVNNATTSSAEYRGNQVWDDTTWAPVADGGLTLDYETDYYWRIDEVHSAGPAATVFTGDVWSFTTESSPPP
jgi:hypothetical protein